MKIGLIDVDGHNFPNLPLMKLSAWYKSHGDTVEWANTLEHYDCIYMSKVFTFTSDDDNVYQTDEIIRGGTGYDLKNRLPFKIERTCPDYSLYPQYNEAYGFLTRGCPRNCPFCIVTQKEGSKSLWDSDLSDFHRGQKIIKLLDPNLLACNDRELLLKQLIDSKTYVDFTQGLDIRFMHDGIIKLLNKIKIKCYHFAWDNPNEDLTRYFEYFTKYSTVKDSRRLGVYVLTNFNTTHEQDLYRVYKLREMGYDPYVMIYDKDNFVDCDKNGKPIKLKKLSVLIKKYTIEQICHFEKCWDLQRWVNNKFIWRSCAKFEDYNPKLG